MCTYLTGFHMCKLQCTMYNFLYAFLQICFGPHCLTLKQILWYVQTVTNLKLRCQEICIIFFFLLQLSPKKTSLAFYNDLFKSITWSQIWYVESNVNIEASCVKVTYEISFRNALRTWQLVETPGGWMQQIIEFRYSEPWEGGWGEEISGYWIIFWEWERWQDG